MKTATVNVRITDLDEFKAWLKETERVIASLRAEIDELEERYEPLLADCGGARPE